MEPPNEAWQNREGTLLKKYCVSLFFGNNDVLHVTRFFHVVLFYFHLSCSRCQDYKLPDETDINNHYQSCLETVNSCPIAYQRSPPPLYTDPSVSSHPAVSAGEKCCLSSRMCACECVLVWTALVIMATHSPQLFEVSMLSPVVTPTRFKYRNPVGQGSSRLYIYSPKVAQIFFNHVWIPEIFQHTKAENNSSFFILCSWSAQFHLTIGDLLWFKSWVSFYVRHLIWLSFSPFALGNFQHLPHSLIVCCSLHDSPSLYKDLSDP